MPLLTAAIKVGIRGTETTTLTGDVGAVLELGGHHGVHRDHHFLFLTHRCAWKTDNSAPDFLVIHKVPTRAILEPCIHDRIHVNRKFFETSQKFSIDFLVIQKIPTGAILEPFIHDRIHYRNMSHKGKSSIILFFIFPSQHSLHNFSSVCSII